MLTYCSNVKLICSNLIISLTRIGFKSLRLFLFTDNSNTLRFAILKIKLFI